MKSKVDLLIESLRYRKPILVLGAGFSLDAQCKGEPLPSSKGLQKILFEEFYINHPLLELSQNDIQSIKGYDLKEICLTLENEKRGGLLQKKLISIFKGATPKQEDSYYDLITQYYWDKIYTLNIDDLLENIYTKNGVEFVVQNEGIRKPCDSQRQILKLHGCVNCPEGKFIFSNDDYANVILQKDYRFQEFIYDFFHNDVVFLGTEFNELDLNIFIEQGKQLGYDSGAYRYYFVSPKTDYKLRSLISSKNNYYYVEWTAEEFLQECAKLNKKDEDLHTQELILQQYGFIKVEDNLNIPQNYESKLYYGNNAIMWDIIGDWDIIHRKTDDVCREISKKLLGKSFVLVITGGAFVGKTVAAYRVLWELYKNGYESYLYNCAGEEELKLFYSYLEKQTSKKNFAVLIDDAAYIYDIIANYLNNHPKNIDTIIFILVSDEAKHKSKKHNLDNILVQECVLDDKFEDILPIKVYNKLNEKNRLGRLKRLDKNRCVQIIKQSKYLVEFLFNHTNGMGFKQYFANRLEDFKRIASDSDLECLKLICILTKLGLHNIDDKIFMSINKTINKQIFGNILVNNKNDQIITLRCAKAFDDFLISIDQNECVDLIYKVAYSLSRRFREEDNNRWKNIFEQILRVKSLTEDLKLQAEAIVSLFAILEKQFSGISYYWLQRGLAKQLTNNFDDALIFLNQALSIRPSSYQIRHAIAKNRLKEAIYIAKINYEESQYLFDEGIQQLLYLIETPKYSKSMKYSVHSYIDSYIKYYNEIGDIIPVEEIMRMHDILYKAARYNYDSWMKESRESLYHYCSYWVPECCSDFSREKFIEFEDRSNNEMT